MNTLQSRRREETLEARVPDPVVRAEDAIDPEQEALLADSVGLALLVVLETLPPAERLAFVLYDMFSVPFEETSPIVGRSATAARQLASRGRRRVKGAVPVLDPDPTRQRAVVGAFLAAARKGDFDGLLAVLDPDVALRADRGAFPVLSGGPSATKPGSSRFLVGSRAVAEAALEFARLAPLARPALVNGAAGLVVGPRARPLSVMGFTVAGGRIAEIDILADPERLRSLHLGLPDG